MKKTTIMGLEEKWETLIVYIFGILGFIFAFMKEDYVSENMRFQYKQAGATWIVTTVLNIINVTTNNIIGISLSLASGALSLVIFIFMVITVVNAFEGKKYEIPVISNLANAIWKE